MNKIFKTFTCLVLLSLSLTGCSAFKGEAGLAGPKGDTGAQGEAGPKLKGNWVGYVVLSEANGSLITDKSGVTVTVSNASSLSTSSLTAPISVTTNAEGKFVVRNLENGTYTLTFSKEGFGDMKYFNVGFSGDGDVLYTPLDIFASATALSKQVDFELVTANITSNGGTYIRLKIKTNLTTATFGSFPRTCRVFVGYTSDVSKDNYIYTTTQTFSSVDSQGITPDVYIYLTNGGGLPSGVTLNAVAYSSGPGFINSSAGALPTGYYFDPVKNKTIFTSLGSQKTNVLSFKL